MVKRGGATNPRRAWARIIALAAPLMAACLLPGRPAYSLRLPTEEPGLRLRVYVQWNQDYLSLAAKVPDFMVTGSNVGPMSNPEQDDAIEFCFETPSQRPPFPAHRLIISAAGGMTLFTRDPGGRWRPDNSWVSGPRTLKYAVEVDGTLNDPTDEDRGFVVECAIPWDFLHGAPIDGPDIGLNVVCWMQGDSGGLASWAPAVREPDDVGESLRWGRMRISTSAALAKASGTWVPSPFVVGTPLIDGTLAANEWLAASTLEFDKPEPTLASVPSPGETTGLPPLLLAVYRCDWQWDAPAGRGAPFWSTDGAPATADQPRAGAGPWYSSHRVDWHRAELEEIQRAGIDIILASYRGDGDSSASGAGAALDYLTEALKYRRADGESYPSVGMLLDTTSLRDLDLTSESGKRQLYAIVRDFFLHISPEFWAELPSRPGERGAGGVPVLLGDPDGLRDWDGSFLHYCNQRFAEDFGGARLAWLGSTEWASRGADGFYAHIRLPWETGFTQEVTSPVPAVALSPGYCPPAGEAGKIRPRRDGSAYRADWQRAVAARPELIVINSWNDFANGTEIAPSRQYGIAYVDATQYFKARLGSQQPHCLRLKKQAVPRILRPGTDYLVELLVENLGTEDVGTGRHVTADYRIVRASDGETVQHKIAAQSVSILAGQTKRLPVVISTNDANGRPLPPGDYMFSLVIVRSKVAYLRSRWFTRALAELTVPITVGEPPARRATVLSTSLPSTIEYGGTEQVIVRLRNDGAETWRQDSVRLGYRWLVERDEHDAATPLAGAMYADRVAPARAELPRDVEPGEVVSVLIPVAATEDQGTISRGGLHGRYSCRIQWDLVEAPDTWFSDAGAPLLHEAIQVLPDHLGVAYESVNHPAVMDAGQEVEAEVVLCNSGTRIWKAGESSISPRWHRWDGREPLPARTQRAPWPFPDDVPPGSTVRLGIPLEAPAIAGPYSLTWHTVINGARALAYRYSVPSSPVLVQSSKVHPVDLSPFVNVVALTTDSHRARGDLDGSGRSLPAEWLPPDQSAPPDGLYPSGYYAPDPAETAPFTFPDTTSGMGGAVACAGQSIPLGDEGAARVHLLAASTAASRQVEFGLKHPSGRMDRVTVTVPSWAQRDQSALIGAYAPYTRTLTSDDPTAAAYLYHLVLHPTSAGAASLELPRAPEIKILAITVEAE